MNGRITIRPYKAVKLGELFWAEYGRKKMFCKTFIYTWNQSILLHFATPGRKMGVLEQKSRLLRPFRARNDNKR
jgi:hypothetical protein